MKGKGHDCTIRRAAHGGQRKRALTTVLAASLFLIGSIGAFGMERRGEIKAGKVKLVFSVPERIEAYSWLPITYQLEGSGKVAVEALAYSKGESPKNYSARLPHKIRLAVRFASQDDKWARFEITNRGDTTWHIMANAGPGISDFGHDLQPRETLERVMSRRERYSLDLGGEKLRVSFAASEVGQEKTTEEIRRPLLAPKPLELSQFMYAYAVHELNDRASGTLQLQMPPWERRVIVRLVTEDGAWGTSVPVAVDTSYLKLKPARNTRWTLDRKPALVLLFQPSHADKDSIRAELKQYQQLLGDYVLALWVGPPERPNGTSYQTARIANEMGIKFFPLISYVRQTQWWEPWSGKRLMRAIPNPKDGDDRGRIDALDPIFPEMVAEYVDLLFQDFGDALYQTADGNVPIEICGESGYGYALGHGWPTRWGGGTKEDVAAFQNWLRQKYEGEIARLNLVWRTNFEDFSEIDPSPICQMTPSEYPDPWKEWSPALEDFDRFRTWLWSQFYMRIAMAIKNRHPDMLIGLNSGFADFANEGEPMYGGIEEWGLGINWNARRTATMPEGLLWADFFTCINTSSENGARKLCRFWRTWGKEVVSFPRNHYYAGRLGPPAGNLARFDLAGVVGDTAGVELAMYPIWKGTWEEGGIVSMPHHPATSVMTEWNEREAALFAKEARAASNTIPATAERDNAGAFATHPGSPRHFVYAGKPFFFVGKSAFSLIDADWRAFIDEADRDGFSVLRIWLCIPSLTKKHGNDHSKRNQSAGDCWPFGGSPEEPDFTCFNEEYFHRLDAILDYLQSKGMVAELTLFTRGDYWPGGPYAWDEVKQRYVKSVIDRYRNRPNLYYEIANEYYAAEQQAFVEKVGDFIWQHDKTHLVTSSSGDAARFAAKPWYRLHNIHASRGQNWWLRGYEGLRPTVRQYQLPVVNDEPMGSLAPDDREKGYPGRDTDPAHHRINFWMTAMAGAYATFHSHKGINALVGHSPGQEFVKPFRRFWETVRFWELEAAPESVKAGDAFAMASSEELAAYLPNGGSVTLDLTKLEGTLKVRWYNPTKGWFGKVAMVSGGGQVEFKAPASGDWALKIWKSG